jgi:hypothetical protein
MKDALAASASHGEPGLRLEFGPLLHVNLFVTIPTSILLWLQQKGK